MGFLGFLTGILGLTSAPKRKIELQKVSAAAGLPIIYGERRVDPITVFKVVSTNNMPITNAAAYNHVYNPFPLHEYEKSYDDNNWLNRIDVWGQGEISAIRRFWVDGDSHTAARFNARPYIRTMSMYGTETQPAAAELALGHSDWTANHKGLGVAYTWSRFLASHSKPQFDSEPELTALVQGVRVYDPRDDDQSLSDPSTWLYSNNRALVALNYLMSSYGLNAPDSDIDFASFATAADLCDSDMDIPARQVNQTGAVIPLYWDRALGNFTTIPIGAFYSDQRPDQTGTTQPLYTADVVLDPKEGVVKNTKKLLEGMGWSLPWSNGKHKLIIEDVVASPVMSFDENTIMGGWTIERGMRSERLNRVTVEFPNANKDYELDTVSWPELSSDQYSDYRDEDNGQELHTNIALESVTDFYRAQAYAEYVVRKSRVSPVIKKLQLAPKALLLEPGDVIAITYADKGFNNSYFMVEAVTISSDLDVSVDLIKYDPTVYGAPALVEEPLVNSPYNPDLWLDPPALQDLELTANYETNADGSVISGVVVAWAAPTGGPTVASVEVAWKKTADSVYGASMILTGGSTSAIINGLTSDESYDVSVTYTTQRGITSDPVEATLNLVGVPTKLDNIEDGATRTVHRGAYDDSETYSKGDVVTYLGSSYIFTALAATSGVEPDDTDYWALLAAGGSYKDIRFKRAATQPATPTEENPAGWADGPPEADGTPLWMTTALKHSDGSLIDVWTTPQEVGGSGLEIEYSSDAISWHAAFLVSDFYMHQRLAGAAAWSDPIRIVGEPGEDGANGGYKDFIYKRSASQPSTPSGTNPSGWSDGIPAENGNPAWESWVWRSANGSLAGSWSTPLNIASSIFEREYSVNGSSSWHTTPTASDRYFRERLAGTGSWSAAVPLKGEGALSDLDSVGTGEIDNNAVSEANWSMSTYDLTALPLDTAVTKGSVSVPVYNASTDKVVVTAIPYLVISGGRANFLMKVKDGSTTKDGGFVTEESHTIGTADKYSAIPLTTRFQGAISPPFEVEITCNYLSSGAAAYVRNVAMTALVIKR
ncbi:phage tail protein [Kordiimonas pumila]|uniref:Phage tail protein n=1 Tax=Kordiimonas pumila TaxID=2161677 RepID=A0ABV7D3C1_9PROT|nr:phage tail protein [Kordiimonas pumila]